MTINRLEQSDGVSIIVGEEGKNDMVIFDLTLVQYLCEGFSLRKTYNALK